MVFLRKACEKKIAVVNLAIDKSMKEVSQTSMFGYVFEMEKKLI